MGIWLTTPDWLFRVLGAGFFLIYAGSRMGEYFTSFPNIGPYWMDLDAQGVAKPETIRYFPLAKILVDLTFLLIALSFCIRLPARRRAETARQIVIPLISGFWPLSPFLLQSALHAMGSRWAAPLDAMLAFGRIGYGKFYIGSAGAFESWSRSRNPAHQRRVCAYGRRRR